MKKTKSPSAFFLFILLTTIGIIQYKKLEDVAGLHNVFNDGYLCFPLFLKFGLATQPGPLNIACVLPEQSRFSILSPAAVIDKCISNIENENPSFLIAKKPNVQFQNLDKIEVVGLTPGTIKNKIAKLFSSPEKQLTATICFLKPGVTVLNRTGCDLSSCAV